MPTKKDIQVILTTPTIQKNLNVAIPMFPNSDQVINISEVNELLNLKDQNKVNEYFSEKLDGIDLVINQKLAFIDVITDNVTTTDLLNQAVSQNGQLFPGNFWIVRIAKFDQIDVTNVADDPEYDLRDAEGNYVPNGEFVTLKNKDWIIYTNKEEFQKIDLNSAVDYNITVHEQLSNAVGAHTQADVNMLFDKAITKNTIKTVPLEPDADSNGEYNNLWFEIIDQN